ncbi:MAG: hypothetical protein L3J71_03920 [Victivallaceae bacterium]|nr:hypothetical protein [Victivallaceae bacterium]
MTSRELVKQTIHFQRPARLPFTGMMANTEFSGDTVAIFPDMGPKWWLGGGGKDEWGCLWEVSEEHSDMGQVKNIVLEILDKYAEITVPDALNPERYAHWEEILQKAEVEDKYVVCCNGSYLFERAHFLHGFEATLMDLMLEPEIMEKFLRHIVDYHFKTVQYINDNFPGRVHGYRGTDDWGTQTAALIPPHSFVELFKPLYNELFAAIHAAGMDAWMHSCGQIMDIIPHLIEVGLDVINIMQPNVFPIERLAAFKGRICFEIGADAQRTLPSGDKELLTAEIEKLLDCCCADKGGFIEMQLSKMNYDGDGIAADIGAFCHQEYRRLDPFKKNAERGIENL